MAASNVSRNLAMKEEFEEDKDLQNELKLLVDKITGSDPKLIPPALEMLKYLIRTSTTSMTSVPKPLKYLAPYYNVLKLTHKNMSKGTMKNIGDWGHEYIRQLESEIVQQWGLVHCEVGDKILLPLINDIIRFNCNHHAEIQACDLLMEIDQLNLLPQYIAENTYSRQEWTINKLLDTKRKCV
ncbi:unnamed protein product [Ceutorhynchus assimilis]|uniref:RPN1 N-terminal domain-containing protein n=1 Tax=Ceutorhynchus assimilis TaxID=467358 RepID=A0A9N9MLA6_9CUCU|nr:unnamed protein product [Ceutorhynchus assimilis]